MTGGDALVYGAIIFFALLTFAIIGATEGWWAALAERRQERRAATPCRLCGRRHASAAERRACDDGGLS